MTYEDVTAAVRHRRVIVAHETNGPKYYGVIANLAKSEGFELRFVETMIERELLRRTLHARRWPREAAAFWAKNWRFRLVVPTVRADCVVVGMGPWDPRLLWYGRLARHNRVIFAASWPNWTDGGVPRDYGPLNERLARAWERVVTQPNAEMVAVTPTVARSIQARFPAARVSVIPHVAQFEFFAARRTGPRPAGRPLRVAQVGELSTKKGVHLWPEILERFGDRPIEVSIVGEGPLRDAVGEMGRNLPVTTLGQIDDRRRLAAVLAEHDVLLVPSQRKPRWEELFGMVVIEAQAAGVVPIASDHVGPRQLIADGTDGFLVEEADVAGFAERLRRVDTEPGLLESLRTGATTAAAGYHPDVIADLWRSRLFPSDSAVQRPTVHPYSHPPVATDAGGCRLSSDRLG